MAQAIVAGEVMGRAMNNLLPVAGDIAQKGAGSIGGAIGSVFGKKGARIGKKIGSGIVGIGRKLLGFESGGKVRTPPVKALKKGGVVMVVPAKPKRKSRRKK